MTACLKVIRQLLWPFQSHGAFCDSYGKVFEMRLMMLVPNRRTRERR